MVSTVIALATTFVLSLVAWKTRPRCGEEIVELHCVLDRERDGKRTLKHWICPIRPDALVSRVKSYPERFPPFLTPIPKKLESDLPRAVDMIQAFLPKEFQHFGSSDTIVEAILRCPVYISSFKSFEAGERTVSWVVSTQPTGPREYSPGNGETPSQAAFSLALQGVAEAEGR